MRQMIATNGWNYYRTIVAEIMGFRAGLDWHNECKWSDWMNPYSQLHTLAIFCCKLGEMKSMSAVNWMIHSDSVCKVRRYDFLLLKLEFRILSWKKSILKCSDKMKSSTVWIMAGIKSSRPKMTANSGSSDIFRFSCDWPRNLSHQFQLNNRD